MMTKTFDCVECGASVPYGRLSCPSCGALLASVAGGRKPAVRVAEAEAEPQSEPQLAPAPVAAPVELATAAREPAVEATAAAVTHAVNADVPAPDANPVKTAAARKRPVSALVMPRTPNYAPTPAVAARARTAAARAAEEAARAAIVPLLEPSAIASLPPTPWDPIVEPPPMLTGRPYQRHLAPEPDPVGVKPPSAYRPPSQAALAMASAAVGANDADRPYPYADGSGVLAAEGTAANHANRWLVTISDPARFAEIAGWFVVVGATMSLLGFLLPWSRAVIGAASFGGYFDGWGLASPTHLLVFLGLLVVLALAILRDPVPAWISSGVLGLVFGGLLLGLAWPYIVGPLGADVGITMTTLGAVALLIGGVVALWATRHVAAEPLV